LAIECSNLTYPSVQRQLFFLINDNYNSRSFMLPGEGNERSP
jgi:hypothetical protein